MRRWQFFLPRTFLMTNGMLAKLRSAGHYEGARGARPARGYGFDKYSCEVASIRSDVAHMVRAYVRHDGVQIHRLNFHFLFIGHEGYDGDAGLLPSKALIDGICDALRMGSDRPVTRHVCTHNNTSKAGSEADWSRYLDCLKSAGLTETHPYGAGVIVYLQEVPR